MSTPPAVPVGIQTLLEKPDETGYAVSENQDSLLSEDLDGGPPRTRLDIIGGGRIVTVQWSGQAKRWQAVRDFFTQNVALNCPVFNLDLIIGTAEYQTYNCNVIPGSIRTSTPAGRYWIIQATLEVAPRDDELDYWPGDICGMAIATAELARIQSAYILENYVDATHIDGYTIDNVYFGYGCDYTAPDVITRTIAWSDLAGDGKCTVFNLNVGGLFVTPIATITVTGAPSGESKECKACAFLTLGAWDAVQVSLPGGGGGAATNHGEWYSAEFILINENGVVSGEFV